jgi:hypothetical protein
MPLPTRADRDEMGAALEWTVTLGIKMPFLLFGLACGSNGSPVQGEAGVFDVLARINPRRRSTTRRRRRRWTGGRAHRLVKWTPNFGLVSRICAATRQGWSERSRRNAVTTKFGEVVQRVRSPSDQGIARQVGSEPCDDVGNGVGDA